MREITYFMLLILLFCAPVFGSGGEDRIVARVGDQVITEAELQEAIEKYVPPGAYHIGVDQSEKDKYRGDALAELIEIELLASEARRRGIEVSEDDIDKIVELNRRKFSSEKAFIKALKAKNMTEDAFRSRIRKFQMANSMISALAKESVYAEDELKAYYEDNRSKFSRPDSMRLYHILLSVDPSAPQERWDERRKEAEDLLGRIGSGEDFGELAYKHSDDPSQVKGGDMGFVHRGMLQSQEVEDDAFSLSEGEVSGVLKSIYGYHIMKAGEKRPSQQMSFEDVKDKLRYELQKTRFEEKKKQLLESVRSQTEVEIY